MSLKRQESTDSKPIGCDSGECEINYTDYCKFLEDEQRAEWLSKEGRREIREGNDPRELTLLDALEQAESLRDKLPLLIEKQKEQIKFLCMELSKQSQRQPDSRFDNLNDIKKQWLATSELAADDAVERQ